MKIGKQSGKNSKQRVSVSLELTNFATWCSVPHFGASILLGSALFCLVPLGSALSFLGSARFASVFLLGSPRFASVLSSVPLGTGFILLGSPRFSSFLRVFHV